MFVNHLLFTLRNRIHFSPHLRYSIKLCKCFRRQMALITRTVFLEIAACGELGKQRCCWFCKELLRWSYFFPLPLCTAKIFHKTWLKFQRSPFASRYSEVEEILIAESIQKWVRFFLSFLYPPPSHPPTYTPILFTYKFVVFWFYGTAVFRERERRVRRLTNGGMLK